LRREGVAHLHLIEPANCFGADFDGTVDGSHPNDLGAYRYADFLEERIQGLLARGEP
jgi:hypothetical protein